MELSGESGKGFMGFGNQPIGVLGTGIHQGQPRPGVEMAFQTLRDSGALEGLQLHKNSSVFHGDLAHPPMKDPYKALYEKTKEIFQLGQTPFLIGGDHSQAFATVSAVVENDPDVKVLWVDAHGDINTPESSPSGNTHGMPLSGLLNIVDRSEFNMPWLNQSLKPENVALIGIRDLDKDEMRLIQDNGVHHYSSRDVHKRGVKDIMLELGSVWGSQSPVHLSFDVDAMDSRLIPATGTPVGGGLELAHGQEILRTLNHLFLCTSVEIVEFNPSLAPNSQGLQDSLMNTALLLKEFQSF